MNVVKMISNIHYNLNIYKQFLNEFSFYKNYDEYYEITYECLHRDKIFETFFEYNQQIIMNVNNNKFVENHYDINYLEISDIKKLYKYIYKNFDTTFRDWLSYIDAEECCELLEMYMKREVERWMNIFKDMLKYHQLVNSQLSVQRITTLYTIYNDINIHSNRKIRIDNPDGMATFLYYYRICVNYIIQFNSYYKKRNFYNNLELMFGENNHPDALFDYNCEQLCELLEDIIYEIQTIENNDFMDLSDYIYVSNHPKDFYTKYLSKEIGNCYICLNENVECYMCVNKHTFSCIDCSTKINNCPLCRYTPN